MGKITVVGASFDFAQDERELSAEPSPFVLSEVEARATSRGGHHV